MNHLLAALGFLLAGLSFPGMFWIEGKRALPRWPDHWVWDATRSWTHNLKDMAVEAVRYDSQYWTKAFLFVIVLLVLLNILQWLIRKRN